MRKKITVTNYKAFSDKTEIEIVSVCNSNFVEVEEIKNYIYEKIQGLHNLSKGASLGKVYSSTECLQGMYLCPDSGQQKFFSLCLHKRIVS